MMWIAALEGYDARAMDYQGSDAAGVAVPAVFWQGLRESLFPDPVMRALRVDARGGVTDHGCGGIRAAGQSYDARAQSRTGDRQWRL